MTTYSVIRLGQHWFRQWLGAWQHQAIAWTNVDFSSVRSFGIHLRATSQARFKISIIDMSLKIINSKLQLHIPGANELKYSYMLLPKGLYGKWRTCPESVSVFMLWAWEFQMTAIVSFKLKTSINLYIYCWCLFLLPWQFCCWMVMNLVFTGASAHGPWPCWADNFSFYSSHTFGWGN